jgi:hypothetical protein
MNALRTADSSPSTAQQSLFASWKGWADDHNLKPGTTQALSEALADRGFAKSRNNTGQRRFRNLTVRSHVSRIDSR